jgi:hypothetical protein
MHTKGSGVMQKSIMSVNHWEVCAENKQRIRVYFYGKTRKEAISKFDAEYSRQGFIIVLTQESAGGEMLKQQFLKSTYR